MWMFNLKLVSLNSPFSKIEFIDVLFSLALKQNWSIIWFIILLMNYEIWYLYDHFVTIVDNFLSYTHIILLLSLSSFFLSIFFWPTRRKKKKVVTKVDTKWLYKYITQEIFISKIKIEFKNKKKMCVNNRVWCHNQFWTYHIKVKWSISTL